MYWEAKNNVGNITLDMIKKWKSAHHYINEEGQRIDYVWDKQYGWISAHQGFSTVCCHDGYPELFTGSTTDTKVIDITNRKIYWSVGRGCEWEGLERLYRVP